MTLLLSDIVLPEWLVTSQWVLLFALGALLILAYRQIGYLLNLRDIGTERDGLAVGEKAPAFEYFSFPSQQSAPMRFHPEGHWSLLLFAEPGCASCQHALAALEKERSSLLNEVHVHVCTSAAPAQIRLVEAFRMTSLSLVRVSGEVMATLYRTSTTPFLYLINPEGIVKAKGAVPDERTLRKLIQQVNSQTIKIVTRTT